MSQAASGRREIGWLAALVVFALYGGMALSVDFKTASGGIQSDEATYYLTAYSLAYDQDLEYRTEDLVRGFREFPSGPSGIFLKRGTDVDGARLTARPPFFEITGTPDPDTSRLYFGKSFIYPLFAAPFVRLLDTNGFLLLNALLLTAAFLAAYFLASARSGPASGLLWAGAFVFASVVPVYMVWTTPELFNWALASLATFLWVYKYVSPTPSGPRTRWLRDAASDAAAAAIIGLLTFSKVTNILLLPPMLAWLAWTRAWRRLLIVGCVAGGVAVAAFAINVRSSGEWNYQGGDRRTCYATYPMQRPGLGIEACDERGRDEALGSIIFDPEVFWSNLTANVVYFVVGRNSGLVPYFFPLVFAALVMALAWRRTAGWQWALLAGIVAHSLVFVVTMPYSFFGGGGTVGNRYFMGVYGAGIALLPALSARWFAVPWLVGGLFVAKLVLTPFQTSIRPGDHSKSGPYRLLPVEQTNVNTLPINTDGSRVRLWYGDTGEGDRGFQIYYLDDNSYLQEADRKSFWIRGESRAEVLIKTDRPARLLDVRLTAGAVPTTASVHVNGRQSRVELAPNQTARVQLPLGSGFPFKMDRASPAYVWVVEIESSGGFVPAITDGSEDRRFLGVLVRPTLPE